MSEPVPAAPAAEPVAPTAPASEPVQAPVTEPAAPAAAPSTATTQEDGASYFTPEQLKEMETFYRANGGYDRVFNTTKSIISRPEAYQKPQEPVQQPQAVQQPPQPVEAPQNVPQQPPTGSFSLEEMAAINYFDRLAGLEQYQGIADDIRSGKVLEGLKSFNITPISNGRINDADVRRYLDLYAASKPPVPTSAGPTADTQIEYVPVQEVKTMEDATKIQLQNIQLRAEGKPQHPATEAANEFVKNYYSNKK